MADVDFGDEYDLDPYYKQFSLDHDEYPKCSECGLDRLVYSEGSLVCTDCGVVVSDRSDIYSGPPIEKTIECSQKSRISRLTADQRDLVPDIVLRNVYTCSLDNDSKYKRIFHCNERIRQWCLEDPPIPREAFEAIEEEWRFGPYPGRSELGKADIERICRAAKFNRPNPFYPDEDGPEESCQRYIERWKTLLFRLSTHTLNIPSEEVQNFVRWRFKTLQGPFQQHKNLIPRSRMKNRRGVKMVQRKNFSNFNHTFQKILESKGFYDWHWEFPTIKTPSKVHFLDDVMEKCAADVDMPFRRSVVLDRSRDHKKLRRNSEKKT
ncbi:hypothetical protein KJ807_05520 [Patescibacteria group bacterium]|nr:hypothetical protein [Patescibacteria group bacterium]